MALQLSSTCSYTHPRFGTWAVDSGGGRGIRMGVGGLITCVISRRVYHLATTKQGNCFAHGTMGWCCSGLFSSLNSGHTSHLILSFFLHQNIKTFMISSPKPTPPNL
jgi:hypothetical protein